MTQNQLHAADLIPLRELIPCWYFWLPQFQLPQVVVVFLAHLQKVDLVDKTLQADRSLSQIRVFLIEAGPECSWFLDDHIFTEVSWVKAFLIPDQVDAGRFQIVFRLLECFIAAPGVIYLTWHIE